MPNEVTIKLDQDKFNSMLVNKVFEQYEVKYEIKEVSVKDELFENDMIHKELKDKSIKAYKAQKEYEFNKRHNIKTNGK
jgi:hypothetical protein